MKKARLSKDLEGKLAARKKRGAFGTLVLMVRAFWGSLLDPSYTLVKTKKSNVHSIYDNGAGGPARPHIASAGAEGRHARGSRVVLRAPSATASNSVTSFSRFSFLGTSSAFTVSSSVRHVSCNSRCNTGGSRRIMLTPARGLRFSLAPAEKPASARLIEPAGASESSPRAGAPSLATASSLSVRRKA